MLTGFDPGRQHATPPVQPEPRQVQADRRSPARRRRAWTSRSPTRTSSSRRPGAPTSASTSKLPWGMIGDRRVHLQPRRRTASTTSTPTCRPRSRRSTARDNRPRWVGTSCAAPTAAPLRHPHQQRARQPDHQRHRPEEPERRPVVELRRHAVEDPARPASASRAPTATAKSRNTVDRRLDRRRLVDRQRRSRRPEQPGARPSRRSPGHRLFITRLVHASSSSAGARRRCRRSGQRTPTANTSYLFSGDMNGDTATGNDLIYIPRDISEMNFAAFTDGGGTDFTAGRTGGGVREPTSTQDPYLSQHRGEYAQRGAVFLPMVKRMDLSLGAGHLQVNLGPAARRPDPARHHELRQPAELTTGASASASGRTRS